MNAEAGGKVGESKLVGISLPPCQGNRDFGGGLTEKTRFAVFLIFSQTLPRRVAFATFAYCLDAQASAWFFVHRSMFNAHCFLPCTNST